MVAAAPSLMTEDEARECVRAVNGHLQGARALLLDLYEREGWRALGYESWRACAISEFEQSKSHLYRQLDAARLEREFSPMGEIGVLPERRLREIAAAPPEERQELFEQAHLLPTRDLAALVREARTELTVRVHQEPRPTKPIRPSIATVAQPQSTARFYVGDVRAVLGRLDPEFAQCVMTSPPFWGLRDYKIPPAVWGGRPTCTCFEGFNARERVANLPPRPDEITVEALVCPECNGCRHWWEDAPWRWYPGGNQVTTSTLTGGGKNHQSKVGHKASMGAFCACGAWLGQLGLEPWPSLYVEHIVEAFRSVWRALKKDGVLWLEIGDSYAGSGKGPTGWSGIGNQEERQGFINDESGRRRGFRPGANSQDTQARRSERPGFFTGEGSKATRHLNGPYGEQAGVRDDGHRYGRGGHTSGQTPPTGFKPKDLLGIPWRVAFALQADGWYLRNDDIWCLSGGTRVYARTQKGETPTTVKDLARLRPETIHLWNGERWTQVLGMAPTTEREGAIELTLRSGERLNCTPHHEWPTHRGNVRADDLRVGDVLLTARLPEPQMRGYSGVASPEHLPDDEIGWFVGLYIAEGSRSGKTIQFAGHAKEVHRMDCLQRLAAAYHGSAHMHMTGGLSMTVNVESDVLGAVLDLYVAGRTSGDKHLTNRCWQRSDRFLEALLLGYLEGDGHYDQRNRRWRLGFRRNYGLEADVRTLCARLGWGLRLKLSTTRKGEQSWPSLRGQIRIEASTHLNTRPDSEVIAIRQSRSRKFWHIGVEDEPHMFALASGVLSCNSRPNPMPESVKDRCTRAHSYVFQLAKRRRFYYDWQAVAEPTSGTSHPRGNGMNPKAQADEFAQDERANGRLHRSPASRSSLMASRVNDQVEQRNKRTVWTIPTRPFSGWDLLSAEELVALGAADYVGPGGKAYRASPDCPVHGQPRGSRTQRKDECDGPQAPSLRSSPDSAIRHGPEQAPESHATARRGSQGSLTSSDPARSPQSTHENTASVPTRTDEPRSHRGTARTAERPASNSDSEHRHHSTSASLRSNGTHKTDPAALTTQPCSASAESPFGRQRNAGSLDSAGSVEHSAASSSEMDDFDARPSGRTPRRTAGTDAKCSCLIVSVDHFATFPPELVVDPIKATSRVGDVVLDPFSGAGTVALVAARLGRDSVGIDANAGYVRMAERRLLNDAPMLVEVLVDP